jgi:putative membrane protein
MYNHKELMKKFVGTFVGVAGISTLIVFPGMVQANINSSSSNSSSKSLLSQNTPGTTSPSGSTTTPNGSLTALDQEFMTKAAQSDKTEIQTSQLALKRSQNKQVRDFAQRMIKEHTDSSKQLKQIAQKKSFKLPKDIGQENKALLTQLSNLNGTNFDQAYMQGQVQAHTKTLADYQNYLSQGQDSDLSAFANKIAPIVADHLQMAQNMTGGSGSSSSGTPGSVTPGSATP